MNKKKKNNIGGKSKLNSELKRFHNFVKLYDLSKVYLQNDYEN